MKQRIKLCQTDTNLPKKSCAECGILGYGKYGEGLWAKKGLGARIESIVNKEGFPEAAATNILF